MALDVNQQEEAYRVGAAIALAARMGLLTDAGVAAAGVKQVETLTVVGTVGAGGAGNITVTVIAAGHEDLDGAGKDITVAVANNDTAAQIAGKIRTALQADADVGHADTGFFVVSGASAAVILTAKVAAANDETMNVGYVLDTATGPTEVEESVDTTAGSAGAAGLRTFVNAATPGVGAGDAAVVKAQTVKAIDRGEDLGLFTDANTGDLTTVAGLIALTGKPAHYTARPFFD